MDIKKYKNGNTYVTIDLDTGTKTRFTKDNEFVPDFAESLDVTITDCCDGLCDFCYAGCTPQGKHADLFSDYMRNIFIPNLKPYTELALNGNDLTHPHLDDFLYTLREHQIITNLTVNQRHFMDNIGLLRHYTNEGLIHGLGVSLSNSEDKKFIKEVQTFPNAVIHTIAGILTITDITNLSNNNLKILILGYKQKERGINYYNEHEAKIKSNIYNLNYCLHTLLKSDKFNVISFDNLALEQLDIKDMITPKEWEKFYMGDDGTFTFFVDLVKHKYAKSSLETEMFDIGNMSPIEMFQQIVSEK